jgi:hypothetical protein
MNAIAHPAPASHHHRPGFIVGVAGAAAAVAAAAIFVVASSTPDPVSRPFAPPHVSGGAGQGVTSACFRPPMHWNEVDGGPIPTCVHP